MQITDYLKDLSLEIKTEKETMCQVIESRHIPNILCKITNLLQEVKQYHPNLKGLKITQSGFISGWTLVGSVKIKNIRNDNFIIIYNPEINSYIDNIDKTRHPNYFSKPEIKCLSDLIEIVDFLIYNLKGSTYLHSIENNILYIKENSTVIDNGNWYQQLLISLHDSDNYILERI